MRDGRRISMVRRLWGLTVHVFQHILAVMAGLVLIIVGLALTFSIVMVVPGIILLAVGVAVVMGGIFAHAVAGP